MKTIHFATKNTGKFNSVSKVLADYNIETIHASLDLPEPRSDDLGKIAGEKVRFAYEQIKKPCIALDVGFYIQSLNGFPKAFVNFALETIGTEGILSLVYEKPRECEFRECLAYLDSKMPEPVFFESNIKGKLSEMPRGEMKDYIWSKLSLIFIPENYQKTLGEMTRNEYDFFRIQRHKESFATKSAKWFSEK